MSQPTAAIAFAVAARRYWLSVFPVVRREICRLRRRARAIPDPVLRDLALDAQLRKWASLEGAAAFAAFVAPKQRASVARLLVDLQGVFDYADTLMEQPSDTPHANARRLHAAFVTALRPELPHSDYYEHHDRRRDGGYLVELVDRCRAVIRTLPSHQLVAEIVARHAERVLLYQAEINLASADEYPRIEQRISEQEGGPGLRWWEIGAACGSSLAIFAHLASAADPALTSAETRAVDALYWPWAEALHIFLDSLIDRAEDRETNQPNLLDHYLSPAELSDRLGLFASETAQRASRVAPHHRVILAGMVGLYLSDGQAWTGTARPASERVLEVTGSLARPALWMLRGRRLIFG